MKTKKLLKKLAAMLSLKGEQPRKAELESLVVLLEKLHKKEQSLEQKLAAAQELGDDGKEMCKRLADKLRVLRAQRAKGVARRDELEDDAG